MHTKWVHPEVVESLRIARRDVPRYSFIESKTRKKTKCGSQHLFAMQSLLRGGGEHRRWRYVRYICGCSSHLALPCPEKCPDLAQCPRLYTMPAALVTVICKRLSTVGELTALLGMVNTGGSRS